ncbi:MAG: cupin domain-containing protein [Pigmentiphaga sp.]|nr:cupin domain-containing protein [Pigmentiphaga sp.]
MTTSQSASPAAGAEARITPISDAPRYVAPRHFDMDSWRLQGGDASAFGCQVGLSVFHPGGGAEHGASTVDRVYVVTAGEITLTMAGEDRTLRAYDSCFIPAGQARSLKNHGVLAATLITIIAS